MVADGRGRIRAMMNDDCRADERGSEPPRGCQVQVQPASPTPTPGRPPRLLVNACTSLFLVSMASGVIRPGRPSIFRF
jgi:hypothetical protein